MQALISVFQYFYRFERRWLQIWSLLYFGFLSLGLIFPHFVGITILRYTGICLYLVYAYHHSKSDYLLLIALFFTLLADTILVINSTSIVGVFVFCFSQFFHLARLRKIQPKALTFYFFIIILIFFFSVLQKIEPIFVVAAIYATALLLNVGLSSHWYHQQPHDIAATSAFFGFLLFLSCDFCVANSYLSYIGFWPAAVYPIANYLAWFFYFPSQALIANSSNLPCFTTKNHSKLAKV